MKSAEVRHLLFTKAIELRFNQPYQNLIFGLNRRIEGYKRRVGLKSYLSEMLGDWAKRQTTEFCFYLEDGERISIGEGFLLDVLARQSRLPFKIVEIETEREKYI